MMQYKRLTVAILTAGVLFTVAGCSSNQAVKTTDGKTIVISNHRDNGSEIFLLPSGGGDPQLISPH